MGKARCSFEDCNSAIIEVTESDVVLLRHSVFEDLKLMQLAEKHAESRAENEFLVVGDVWDFDNIGVSKDIPRTLIQEGSVNQIEFSHGGGSWRIEQCTKYLICSDCDKGPIGAVCTLSPVDASKTENKVVYLLSLESVRHL